MLTDVTHSFHGNLSVVDRVLCEQVMYILHSVVKMSNSLWVSLNSQMYVLHERVTVIHNKRPREARPGVAGVGKSE